MVNNETNLDSWLKHLPAAYAYHQVITNEAGEPVDYLFLQANPAFEAMTGLKVEAIMGRRVTEVLPGIESGDFDWIGTFGQVALTGESCQAEQYAQPLDRWYSVTAYSDEPEYFAVLFHDITKQQREKETLKSVMDFSQRFLDTENIPDLQEVTEYMRTLTGAAYAVFNLFDDNGLDFTTKAIAGASEQLMKAAHITGFNPVGRKWPHDPDREVITQQTSLTTYHSLTALAGKNLPPTVVGLLEKTLNTGLMTIVNIMKREKLMGHFALIMPRGRQLENPELTALFASQVGLLQDREEYQHKLEESKEALQKSETSVRNKLKTILEPTSDLGNLKLGDIIDVPAVQNLMNRFHRITGLASAVVDNNGKVLVSAGWQEICTKFHRCHPETLKHCQESDMFLAQGVAPGTFKEYLCKNGMIDMVSPIEVAGQHLGNIYFGQFFFADEEPDVEQFRQRARLYGFDETDYIAALNRAPRYDRESVAEVMRFYSGLADMISSLSFSNVSLAQAITKQREAEAELRLQNGLINSLFNSIPDLVFYKDLNGVYLGCNKAFAKLVDMTTEEVVGKTDYDIFTREEAAFFRYQDEQMLQQQTIRHNEEPITYPDGRKVMLDTIKAPLMDSNNNMQGVLGIARDITDRKKAEEKLQEFASQLEMKNQELDVAAREAETANQAKSRYLAHMNHEMRTPLNGFLGFVHLMESTRLDEEQQDFMEHMKQSATNLLGIINNVLDMATIEAGQIKLESRVFLLEEEIETALAPLVSLAGHNNTYLKVTMDQHLPRQVKGDPDRLRQILLNLGGNGVKFARKGQVHITLACRETTGDHHTLQLVVEDTGSGMTEETLKNLFQPFYQGDDGSTSQAKGTGLGLTITKELVELMDGTIQVDSTLGKGTRVEVTLKLQKAESTL